MKSTNDARNFENDWRHGNHFSSLCNSWFWVEPSLSTGLCPVQVLGLVA